MKRESHVIRMVDVETWSKAQQEELECAFNGGMSSGDDWNHWWFDKFNRYEVLANNSYDNVLEVGCGPHTNLRYILPLVRCRRIYLEDPLIQEYLTYFVVGATSFQRWLIDTVGFLSRRKLWRLNHLIELYSNIDYRIDLSSSPLEELPYQNDSIDLLICINVLDHVRDYDQCMGEIRRVLKVGGTLVLGQDLSNDEDLRNRPESYRDAAHPVKIDDGIIGESLSGFDAVFRRILDRDEGRNPTAHYATFLGVLKKRHLG